MSKSKRRREARKRARDRREAPTEGARPQADAEAEGQPQAAPPAPPEARHARPARKRPHRRGRRVRISPWLVAVPALAAAVGAVAFLVLSSGSSGTSSGSPAATPDARVAGLTPNVTLNVEASDRGGGSSDSYYNPTRLEAKAGDVIEIVVANTGTVAHNLRVSGPNMEYDVDTTGNKGDDFEMPPNVIKPGETETLVVKIDQPGTYPFRCDFHPQYQTGNLVLGEA